MDRKDNPSIKSDVTENELAKEALIKSELKYRSLFESIGQGFYLSEIIFDKDGIPCDYRYIDINPAFEHIMGISKDQIIGKTYNEFVPSDPESGWLDCFKRVATTGIPENYTFYSNIYNQYYTVYAFRPENGKFCALIKDITEIKHAEEKLRESEEQIRHLSDNLPNGLVYQIDSGEDGRERRFTYIGAGVERLHDITPDDVFRDAMTLYSQILEEDRQMIIDRENFAITNMIPFSAPAYCQWASDLGWDRD